MMWAKQSDNSSVNTSPLRTTAQRRRSIIGFTLAVLFAIGGCGCDLIHDRTIEYNSPDARSRLTIATVGIKPQIRVRLRTDDRESLVYEDPYPPREFYIRFSEVYWTPDSKKVAAYIVPGDSPPLFLAFDVQRQTSVDPKPFQDKIEQKILTDYGLTAIAKSDPSFDAMHWAATSQNAIEAFEEKQGTIPPR